MQPLVINAPAGVTFTGSAFVTLGDGTSGEQTISAAYLSNGNTTPTGPHRHASRRVRAATTWPAGTAATMALDIAVRRVRRPAARSVAGMQPGPSPPTTVTSGPIPTRPTAHERPLDRQHARRRTDADRASRSSAEPLGCSSSQAVASRSAVAAPPPPLQPQPHESKSRRLVGQSLQAGRPSGGIRRRTIDRQG